jgi:hypothetical protein
VLTKPSGTPVLVMPSIAGVSVEKNNALTVDPTYPVVVHVGLTAVAVVCIW